jgi:hypothetical protein
VYKLFREVIAKTFGQIKLIQLFLIEIILMKSDNMIFLLKFKTEFLLHQKL